MRNRIKDLREDNDMKQKDIAKHLKIKENTYCKWENNSNDIPLEKCNELANYYHVTMDYLLGLSNNHLHIDKSYNINWNKLTKRLKELRKEYGYTQTFLGEKVGFHQKTYSNFETGINKPTTFKLLIIAQFYNVSMDYLVGRSDDKNIK